MLKVEGLHKFYGTKNALSNINFELKEGTIIGLVGPNGAGKTTLLKCITGICIKYTGNVLKKENTTIGLVVDDLKGYSDRTLKFNLNYFKITRGLKDYDNAMGILEKLNFDTSLLNRKLKTFSYGMNQKVVTALSLISNPQIVLLDEPFRGLDVESITDFKSLLREFKSQGKAVLFSSHNLDDIEEICDKVIVINKGSILDIIDARVIGTSEHITFSSSNNELALELISEYNPVENNGFIELTLKKQMWNTILETLIKNNVEVLNVTNKSRLVDRVNDLIGESK